MRRLRLLEAASWTAALLLLGTYASTRYWHAYSRDAGVAAFHQVHERRGVAAFPAGAPTTINGAPLQGAAVDMSKWSPQRIARYRQSLNDTTVPQALLRLPALRLTVPVFQGTSERNLSRGAARIEGTAAIGAPGNLGIAAHRDGFFRALENVRIGDTLLLDLHDGTLAYRVVTTRIVEPSDVSVLQPTARPSLTLVTCYPFYYVGSAPYRYIVRAQIVAPGS